MTAAERQRRSRERKAEGYRVLKGSLAVDDNSLLKIAGAGFTPRFNVEDDADVLDIVTGIIDLLAEDEVMRAVEGAMQRMATDEFGSCHGVTGACDTGSMETEFIDQLTVKDLY